MATINMLVGQNVTLNVVPTLANTEAPILGVPLWSTADATLIGLVPSADGRSCKVYGKAAGTTTVTCNAVGAAPLSANHTVVVAAVASALASAMTLTVQKPPA